MNMVIKRTSKEDILNYANNIVKDNRVNKITFIYVDQNGNIGNSGRVSKISNLVYDFEETYTYVSNEDLINHYSSTRDYIYVALFDGEKIILERGEL